MLQLVDILHQKLSGDGLTSPVKNSQVSCGIIPFTTNSWPIWQRTSRDRSKQVYRELSKTAHLTYPLVNIQKLLKMAIEIVDLPIKKCWLFIVFVCLPEGK